MSERRAPPDGSENLSYYERYDEALSHYLLPLASEPVVRVFGKLVQPLMAKSSYAMRVSLFYDYVSS